MKILKIIQAENLAEAYGGLLSNDKALLMAGGVFLRLQKREVPLVVDLSKLQLDYIKEEDNFVHIGAMTTLRTIEMAENLPKALAESTRQIGGVGLRNLVTVGGSICGRYGFSDITTALLSLGAKLIFYKAGTVALDTYLETGQPDKDILMEVVVPKSRPSDFRCFKSVYTDFSLINIGVSYDDKWFITIGARPGRSILIEKESIEGLEINELVATVRMDDDVRASASYRRSLAETLISEALEEVSKWK